MGSEFIIGCRTVPTGAGFAPATPITGWIVEAETFRAFLRIDKVALGRVVACCAKGTEIVGSSEAIAMHDRGTAGTPSGVGFDQDLLGTEWAVGSG